MEWLIRAGTPFPLVAYTDGDVWRPGIGDPTVMGWVTVAAYLIGAVLCGKAAVRSGGRKPWGSREGMVWLGLAVGLAFLGINKQLDLQTWFTLTAREWAIAQGWYEQRRVVQAGFVVMLALAGVGVVAWLWKHRSEFQRGAWLALAGFVLLGCFVVIRAASFHHVDAFLKSGPGGVRMNWVLELGGILMLSLGAWRREAPEDARGLEPARWGKASAS